MINVILAFSKPLPDRTDGDVTLTPEQWLPQDYGGSWVRTTWREPTIDTKARTIFDALLPDAAALARLEADFPDMIVIGEWDYDTGAKKRAIHASAIDVMPDIVEYDEDGNEISRSRPTALRDHLIWAGMAGRDWI